MPAPTAPDVEQEQDRPPAGASILRQSLWWDAKGDWIKAHDLIADERGPAAARVHAYLHRKEGDIGNARYWYSRAGVPPFDGSLDDEWKMLAEPGD